jgi:hypothetical protein
LIGVFDAQNELATMRVSKTPIEQRHVGGANVRIASG